MKRALLLALLLAGCDAVDEPLPPLGACPTDAEFFAARVDPWMQGRCGSCHSAEGAASMSDLLLDGDSVDARFAAASVLAATDDGQSSVLLLKPTNTHVDGHGGGQVLTASSPEYADLVAFVGRVRDEIDDCGDGVVTGAPGIADCADGAQPGPRILRRLSHVEYGNTVRDLLGLTAQPELAFAADNVVHGFGNDAGALQISPLLLEQYRDAAEDLAEQAVVQQLDALMPCEELTTACVAQFVEEFGRRAFRRPLTEDDRARYLGIFTAAAPEDGFAGGIQWVIAGMLQSPHFLYRSELGTRDGDGFALTDWELATELSYLLHLTTPDDTLLDAAASGALGTAEGLQTELDRLLADPRATRTMERFVDHWVQLDRLGIVARDAELYPDFDDATRAAMTDEAHALVAGVVGAGGTVADLLTGGLLTSRALLTVHALPTGSSPIHRGVLVRERLLCQELPPPPANVDASPPPVDPTLSTRERYAAHSDVPECAACHQLIDPIGFGFEHYDAVGAYREMEGPHAIDATGEIVNSVASDGTFDGVDELAALLASSGEVDTCYSQQWLRFGTGLDAERGLACSIPALSASLAADGGRLDGVFAALAALPHFQRRLGEEGELDAPPVGGDLPPITDDTEYPDGGGGGDVGTAGVSTDVTLDDWGTGYCADIIVTNGTSAAVDWEVVLGFDGTIDNVWNAVITDLGGAQYSFVGDTWNANLEAGASTSFGLCGYR